jgi:lipoprotein-anchoring transpeptidase ErfK/SrfK
VRNRSFIPRQARVPRDGLSKLERSPAGTIRPRIPSMEPITHTASIRRVAIAIVGAILFFGLFAAAYGIDASRRDRIAEGVRVAGVELGGMSSVEASRTLRREVARPHQRPFVVSFRGRDFTITARTLETQADVEGMVDGALSVSREGGLPGRLWRYVTGGEVNRDLPPIVSYSDEALDAFVGRVVSRLNQAPVDASVEPSPISIEPRPSEDGLRVREDEMRRDIVAELQSPLSDRSVRAPVDTTKPEVTTEELAARYPHYITISRSGFTLRFYRALDLAATYTIAVGQVGYETPTGLYHVQNKGENVAWHVPNKPWAGKLAGKVIPGGAPNNPIVARWLGIYNGAGIHGTGDVGSLGSAASHGCIRMAVDDVIELYDQAPVGTPVYIG